MKSRKTYTKLLLAGSLMLMSSSLVSCDDFLTITPTNQIPEEEFWKEKGDLENVRAGAYQLLAQAGQTDKILLWGEGRSDNFQLNDMSKNNINYLMTAVLQPQEGMFSWDGFYTGINYCNLILEQGDAMTKPGQEVDPSFTQDEFRSIRAEILALRSLYYFYLVRAFRDVPYVTKAVRTDEQALKERPAAVPGVAILGQCIDTLEATVKFAPENYGPAAENKGRFTRLSIHSLLADMYLWRASLLKNNVTKGLSRDGRINMSDVRLTNEDGTPAAGYQTADGQAITDEYCNTLSTACLNKAIEHADWVLKEMKEDYDEYLDRDFTATADERNQPYPLYRNQRSGNFITDVPFAEIWGHNQNSRESILELQYNGTNTTNGTASAYYTKYDGTKSALIFAVAPDLLAGFATVNPSVGWGKTDFRLAENTSMKSPDTKKPILKFLQSGVTIPNIADLNDETVGTSGMNTKGNSTTHWPIYRLADIMLIKAEAVARTGTTDKATLREAYRLVNELFERNNPALVATEAETSVAELVCDRVSDDFGMKDGQFTKNAAELLPLVYRERQREFFAEGKRWFDLVRQIEFSNDAKGTMANYAPGIKATVVNRLIGNLWSFYNPIYSEELKVNGAENGGSLHQNPVWDRYSKK